MPLSDFVTTSGAGGASSSCQTVHGVCTAGGEMLATVKVSID